MERHRFLQEIDELLEHEPGTLNGAETLASLENWDSLTVLGFIAMVDEKFGVAVDLGRLADSKTVDDLAALLDGKVTA